MKWLAMIAVTFVLSYGIVPALGQTETDKTSAVERDDVLVYEREIEASVSAVWKAFTTNEGIVQWMAPLAEIDLRIGGKIVANYNKDGQLGDATTIENTILCYEPERMLALKATKFPAGFPFEEAAQHTWSICYFTKVGENRTHLRYVGLGYGDDEQSKQMKSFFATANKQVIDQLNEVVKSK